MTKFKKGDRVYITKGGRMGERGTVMDGATTFPAIQLDHYTSGNHDCMGLVRNGYGWWVNEDHMELVYKRGSLDEILYAPYALSEGEEIE